MAQLQISRDGQHYGSYDEEDVRHYLQQNQILLTDQYWTEGMEDWQPCSALIPPPIPTATPSRARGSHVCPSCGVSGSPVSHTPGSMAVELVLWLFFIVPGLIYSCWRLCARRNVCPACKNPMIPSNTPLGQNLLK